MTEQEIIEMLAAILLEREGGEMVLDKELMELKELPEFDIDIDEEDNKIYVKLLKEFPFEKV